MPNQILLITGVVVLVVGIGAYRKPNSFRKILGSLNTNLALLYVLGLVNLIIGLFLIINFSAWTTIPEALVAFIGIAAVIKGFMMVIFPTYTMNMSLKVLRDRGHLHGEAIMLIVFGIVMCLASLL